MGSTHCFQKFTAMPTRRLELPDRPNGPFHKEGCFRIRNLFSEADVSRLRATSNAMSIRAEAILKTARDVGESLAVRAKAHPHELIVLAEATNLSQVCRYEFMIGGDCQFAGLVNDLVMPTVEAMVGQPVTPFKDKTNEKLPGGGAFGPHQDFAAYKFFEPRYHVTALLSIDESNAQNGCIQFATNFNELARSRPDFVAEMVAGRPLFHSAEGGTTHGDIRTDISSKLTWLPFECSRSDLVIFDSFVPHFSIANHSKSSRRAIFVTFNLATEGSFYTQYYAEKRSNYDDPKFHVSTPTRTKSSDM
jgi:ectoine hydroxylase-related dioxygenase (phytanoyl-CoA dioxygenase family)